jgi:hypothetical protein
LQRTVSDAELGDDVDRTAELLPILTEIMQKNPTCADCNAPGMGVLGFTFVYQNQPMWR